MAGIEFLAGGEVVHRRGLRAGQGRLILGRSQHEADEWLAGEGISRKHAVLEPRDGAWWIIDRSRNGTWVNGEQVTRHRLQDGDVIDIGDNRIRFADREPDRARDSTTRLLRPPSHEEPVAADEHGVTVARAEIRFVRGPREGERMVLDRPLVRMGGSPDDDVVLAGLEAHALDLNVVRGRMMVVPRTTAVRVGGGEVPGAAMPVWDGEEVSVGQHAFEARTTFTEISEARASFGELVGASPAMQALFGALGRIAAHDHPVLLTGESGTGKELAATALHAEGLRSTMPFEAVNCAALAETLIESQLFGHIKGAFTGATDDQPGAFQRASGGTLFLDEIGELKLDAQAKLLRALESGEVRRLGARQAEYPDVRVIAATNRDLPAMVRDARFRGDLYFRLSVLSVRMPPLRDRPEDITQIARTLIRRHLPGTHLTPEAIERLQAHTWPGNVRELRNVLTRARVLGGPTITPDSLHFNVLPTPDASVVNDTDSDEYDQIAEAMRATEGNKSKAARLLGIPRSSLLYRLKKHGLD